MFFFVSLFWVQSNGAFCSLVSPPLLLSPITLSLSLSPCLTSSKTPTHHHPPAAPA
ncbi:hypothetical protein CsSME_00016703 [Camellia sinensis var. sinensis]